MPCLADQSQEEWPLSIVTEAIGLFHIFAGAKNTGACCPTDCQACVTVGYETVFLLRLEGCSDRRHPLETHRGWHKVAGLLSKNEIFQCVHA